MYWEAPDSHGEGRNRIRVSYVGLVFKQTFPFMRLSLFTLLVSVITLVSAQEFSLAKLDSSDFFNFWEGTWEGTWPEGEKEGKATNFIEWTTGGKVLQENFEVYQGQNKGFFGTSISVFNTKAKVWKQAWADNQGGYFDFTGAFDGDKRIFQTTPREVNGGIFQQRMVFYNLTQNAFTWDWESTNDGGKTWTLNWRIEYKRKQ